VTVAEGKLPPGGVKPGDIISVTGVLKPGPDAREPTANGTIDASFFNSVLRGTTATWNLDLFHQLDCL
jgi:hypothetical protein